MAVGIPAKVVCTIDEYYKKRKSLYMEEAFEYARSIKEVFKRKPKISDFYEEFPLFVDGNKSYKYTSVLPIKSQYGDSFNNYVNEHKLYLMDLKSF
ncbi:hypothetical protein [Tenacibaculum adriaticum]|nr:hypothetical protein [Tenacibaculum adriaticum]